jgi:PRTRC genetic system protein E
MFFTQMYALLEGMNLDMSLKRTNDDITVTITPKPTEGGKAKISKPLVLTGSPAELDQAFFPTITEPLQKTAGIIANINIYEDAIQRDQEKAKVSADKSAKKGDGLVHAGKSKPAPKEPEPPKVKLLPAIKQKDFDSILSGLKLGIGAQYTYDSSIKGKMSFTAEQIEQMALTEQGEMLAGLLAEEEGGKAPAAADKAKDVMDKLVQQTETEEEE